MKRCFVAIGVLLCLAVFARAEQKAKAVVVKLEGLDRAVTFQVMSPEEFKKLQADLKIEERLFSEAVEAVKKEWEKDEQSRKKPFPKSQLSARQASAGPAMDADKAADKVSRMEEQASKKIEEDAKKAAEKAKQKQDKGGKGPSEAEKKARAERQKLVETAASLVQAKIEQLKTSKATPATGETAKPGAAAKPPASK